MYKSFYKLDREPFDLQPDPTFLWLGEKYKEALSALRYGILDNKGFVLLTGESGVGKTTLLRALTESLPSDILWTFIANPDVPKMEMFNLIGKGFGMNKEYNSKVEFMLDFEAFAQERHDEHKKMLLIVDSAHLLSDENLEELRLLSNIEPGGSKLIHIFFSAQPSFNATLTRPCNNAIRQRLNLSHTIEPLTAQETSEYIEHRFSVAGVKDRIFTEKAVRSVHHFSGGIPKKINFICQQALIEGAERERQVIDYGAVQECMEKFARPDDSNRMDAAAAPIPAPGRGGNKKNFNPRMRGIGVGALALLVIGAGYLFWSQHNQENHTAIVATTTSPPPSKTDAPSVDTQADSTHITAHPAATPPVNNTPDGTGTGTGAAQEPPAEKVSIPPVSILPTVQPAAGEAPGTDSPSGNAAAKNAPTPASATASTANQQAAPSEPALPEPTLSKPALPKPALPEPAPATTSPQAANDKAEEIIIDPQQQKTPVPPPEQNASQTTASAKALPRLKAILPLKANSRSLTSEGQAALTDFVRKFKEAGQGKIEVRGYVSSDNNARGNTQLSLHRAEAVQAMLIRAGVDRASIKVRGMGIQNPLANNNTQEGRNKNRRVELEIIP